ncbi:hypothetical protein GCM10011322_45250 [Salinarimonas ramus]|uniref:Uncharacterized protein n=1 Tax=Salinarimonas ramus TaxID=690164 RepID=A0A917VA24_9HYPH|nr:hypothetical protein GCM10011322_45250 [Salinarimonas ramus]
MAFPSAVGGETRGSRLVDEFQMGNARAGRQGVLRSDAGPLAREVWRPVAGKGFQRAGELLPLVSTTVPERATREAGAMPALPPQL